MSPSLGTGSNPTQQGRPTEVGGVEVEKKVKKKKVKK
jgi:hypothetical protein